MKLSVFTVFAFSGTVAVTAAEPANNDIVERGRAVFAACAVCHAAKTEVPNQGPDLRGVVGRRAGTLPGFRFSRALRESGRTWDEDALAEFLEDPQAAVPGNTMPFPGIPDEAPRRDLIAYLKTLK